VETSERLAYSPDQGIRPLLNFVVFVAAGRSEADGPDSARTRYPPWAILSEINTRPMMRICLPFIRRKSFCAQESWPNAADGIRVTDAQDALPKLLQHLKRISLGWRRPHGALRSEMPCATSKLTMTVSESARPW